MSCDSEKGVFCAECGFRIEACACEDNPTAKLEEKNDELTKALGDCIIALNCMSNLSGRNELHRKYAIEVAAAAMKP